MPPSLQCVIEQLGASGDGIALRSGKKIFIPCALPGETVTIRPLKETTDHIKAELLSIDIPSPARQTPACPHFSRCGGCSFQHLEEEAYYSFKHNLLITALSRAGFAPELAQPLVRIGAASRRRANFKVKAGKLGYYAENSHTLIDISECLVLEPAIMALIAPLKQLLKQLKVTEITVSQSDTGLDVFFAGDAEPALPELELLSDFALAHDLARLSWKSPHGFTPIASRRAVEIILGEVRVTLPVGHFLQASRAGQQAITDIVLKATSNAARIIDLYAGCGTYSFPLAARAHVYAVEGDKAMVQSIQTAASRHSFHARLKTEQRDIFANPLFADDLSHYDAAVINPPRNGAGSQMEAIAQSSVACVVMVSCNPATFARDARMLKEGGYVLEKAVGIDQFYMSSHLEMVGVFRKS